MERKLAAILAADVVGYSRLMEQDEAGTFARVRAHRKELFEPEIERRHGRIFKLMGDGLLAEFGSVVDAVECAVVLQRQMADRNNGLPDDQRIDLRIGVNLGDVIVEGEDRYGDGINIAARLQQLAEPGGICVSQPVVKQVERKVAIAFESAGEQKVKNIAEPVAVFRVVNHGSATRQVQRAWRAKKLYVVSVLVVLFAAGAAVAWHLYAPTETLVAAPSSPPSAEERPEASPSLGIPVIAVLPFENLTGDPTQDYLGKGIAEAFITDLSTFPDLDVVSSTTSFRSVNMTVPEIVKATGATFVIEGSIRRNGDTVSITVQLIRGSTDLHLWSDRFDLTMADPVNMQSAAADRLRNALGGMTGLLRREYEKTAWAKADADLTEYDYHVRGQVYAFRNVGWRAVEEEKKGLERFPDSVLLRCSLSLYSDFAEAARIVDEVAALQKRTRLEEWRCHWALARMYVNRSDRKRAVAEVRAADALAPYDANSRSGLSVILRRAGLREEAIEWAKFAVTHDPNPRKSYFDNLLDAYRAAGKMQEAIGLAEAELRNNPSPSSWWYDYLGHAYATMGQPEKAQEAYKAFYSLPEPPAP